MKKSEQSAHEFALYFQGLPSDLQVGMQLSIDDRELKRRIERVLRLKEGETLLFFNKLRHVSARIDHLDKKEVRLKVLSSSPNAQYSPSITFLLPILKREALGHVVYLLVEAGVNAIQLVQTEKLHRKWGGKKELERLERICIAAAEQSKNFTVPEIKSPVSLQEGLQAIPDNSLKYYGAIGGKPFGELPLSANSKNIVLACGPEADFSEGERMQLQQNNFTSVRLTPTVLRAETAAFCLTALFRTVFS